MDRVTDSTRDVFVRASRMFAAEMLLYGFAETTNVPEPATLDPSAQASAMLLAGIPVAAASAFAIFDTGIGLPIAAIKRNETVTETENTLPEAIVEVITAAACCAAESWNEPCTG